ncbi:MAG: ATP-binding protein [Pseudomonadota bacterium]
MSTPATFLTRRPWSLQRTLLALLLGLTLVLWSFSALIVYLEAEQESQELFDQSLRETGHLLLSLADHELKEHPVGTPLVMATQENRNHRQYLLFQIWGAGDSLLYKNAGAPDTPFARSTVNGFSWSVIDGQRWRIYASWNDSRQLQIQVAEPASHRKEIGARFAYKIIAFALLIVAVAAAAIWWSVRLVFHVLRKSANEVALRTPNDLAEVSLAGAPGELEPLLLAINRLFGRVRQTMEHEQRFTADAAHELRTPLAAIKTNLQVIQRARNDAERDEFLVGLGVSVDRAGRLVDQLMTLAKLDPHYQQQADLTLQDLSALLAEQLPSWREQAQRQRHTLLVEWEPTPCRINRELVLIMVRNLLDNAFRYTPQGGRVLLSCRRKAGGGVCLTVSDSGPGIPAAMRERVFERFFRLAGAHTPGSGLGLSIVRRIADTHGATIRLADGADEVGLAVDVVFPS